jgi:hypothetical protein
MLDINDGDEPAARPAEDLAKAHPAADLLARPGWTCTDCGKRNLITAPFCKHCEEGR